MASYIGLINWADQGIRTFKDSPSRADAVRELSQGMGVTTKEIYWTIGSYDRVVIMDAPDEETLTAALLSIGAGGNVRTTTMRAFTQNEFAGIVARAS